MNKLKQIESRIMDGVNSYINGIAIISINGNEVTAEFNGKKITKEIDVESMVNYYGNMPEIVFLNNIQPLINEINNSITERQIKQVKKSRK